jgi:hypothetical protein
MDCFVEFGYIFVNETEYHYYFRIKEEESGSVTGSGDDFDGPILQEAWVCKLSARNAQRVTQPDYD